jgi:hypothetical protein
VRLQLFSISATSVGSRTTYCGSDYWTRHQAGRAKPLAGFRIRPELRVDCSLNDKKVFNDSRDDRMFTAALDAILTF